MQDILVFLVLVHFLTALLKSFHSHLLRKLCCLFLLLLLFLILDAFKSIEIFSVELIKLSFNPLDGGLEMRDDNEL
jgi:hypothetical protein